MAKITVVDFFCGAGGFSEGFRQQGFSVIYGIDKWEPAISTFNHNFNLNCSTADILKISEDISLIEGLPDSDVIIGSPPCVSFSNSNKSGKADKSLGLRLTEAYLKIVAVKKFKEKSKLKAWYMENVPNSLKYLKDQYSFIDLDLNSWAKENGLDPHDIAVSILGNSFILNSANYGAVQSRNRVITGENLSLGSFNKPRITNAIKSDLEINLPNYFALKNIKDNIPNPFSKKSKRRITDPLYPRISMKLDEISDHFYDTGLYKSQWKNSLFMKRNHPFMGKMSFPENENKPSRTITATYIGTSREAIIYRSELLRDGDGEYRCPTIREMATIMGFPLTFQFKGGSENSKARLVGNAVCVSISRSIAAQLRSELGLKRVLVPKLNLKPNLKDICNLNTYSLKVFDNPPIKKKGSRFRMHPFKDGNLTVTLSNYNIKQKTKSKKCIKWFTSVQLGNGDGYPTVNFPDNYYLKIEPKINELDYGKDFLQIINNGFSEKIASGKQLQEMYETQNSTIKYLEPTCLIEKIADIIEELNLTGIYLEKTNIKVFKLKKQVPVKQMFALYAVNKITSMANK